MTSETSSTGTTDSLCFCSLWANNHTYQSMQIQWYIKPHWNSPPFHKSIDNKGLFCHSPRRWLHFGLWLCMHTHAWLLCTVHCNPHVVSPSCQGPICLHYHHTAGGSRSVGAHGKGNASLSPYKKQLHCLDVFHVTPTQDKRYYEGKSALHLIKR